MNFFKKFCMSTIGVMSMLGGLVWQPSSNVSAAEIVGLQNIGNSCYFNAFLQELYSSDSFRSYMLHVYNDIFAGQTEEDLADDLKDMYRLSKLFNLIQQAQDGSCIDYEQLKSTIDKFVDHRGGDESQAYNKIDSILRSFTLNQYDDIMACFATFQVIENHQTPNASVSVENIINCYLQVQPQDEQKGNIWVFTEAYERPLDVQVSPTYQSPSGVTFVLESLTVDTGGHAVAFVRKDDDSWRLINDSVCDDTVYTFEQMLSVAKSKPAITSCMYCKQD